MSDLICDTCPEKGQFCIGDAHLLRIFVDFTASADQHTVTTTEEMCKRYLHPGNKQRMYALFICCFGRSIAPMLAALYQYVSIWLRSTRTQATGDGYLEACPRRSLWTTQIR